MDYKFTNLQSFIGNKNKIENIIKFINDKNDNFLLIKGESKTGKTKLIKLIFNKLNLNYKYIISNNLPNNKNANNFLNLFYKSANIKTFLSKNFNISNNYLIIDNIELLNNSNKKIITELLKKKFINKKIIFITNKNYFKFNKLIYNSVSNIIEINNPSHNEIYNYLLKLKLNNNLNLNNIIYKYKNINDINLYINDNKILGNMQNTNILHIIKNLFNSNYSFEAVHTLYKYDKYKIPLLLYENFYSYLINFNMLKKFLHSLILYDIIDNYMYAMQYWELQNICGLIPTLLISNLLQNKSNLNEIKFTKYLNKISLISINRKTIYKYFKLLKIYNVHKLYQIIDYLNNINKSDYKLLDDLNIDSNSLQNISKIDKLNII